MQALTTNNPLAPNVAAEYGASCNQDMHGVYHIGNGVSQQDFDDVIDDWAARGVQPKPINMARKAAYDHLQSEGHGRDFS